MLNSVISVHSENMWKSGRQCGWNRWLGRIFSYLHRNSFQTHTWEIKQAHWHKRESLKEWGRDCVFDLWFKGLGYIHSKGYSSLTISINQWILLFINTWSESELPNSLQLWSKYSSVSLYMMMEQKYYYSCLLLGQRAW